MTTSTTARGSRKVRIGRVVSSKGEKTAVVETERVLQHRVYKKYIRRRRKYYAHDERNQCRVGDRVEIVETRPLSKLKCWRIQKILGRQK